ncbi:MULTISPECIES: hypothetical protein [Sphingomonas]|jgi:hypothetical protein|uniref:hypothetical protein n=1 Tax=Sphingomonas TaxID=13687 RepID=UPI000835164C|nr:MULTISPECIES: hypothetical protein [Sphingomonas]MBY0303460.1 hypothetical protein [Sphingomonas ginsenosidimutans]
MIRTILGALVGRELDRRDGRGGAGGALFGALATRAVTRMGPLGMALGGAYVAKKAYDRRKAAKAGVSKRV